MKSIVLSLIFVAATVFTQAQNSLLSQKVSELKFYQLPYEYSALEPVIDALTVEIHYSRHHKAYFNNFMKLAAEMNYLEMTVGEVFSKASSYPAGVRNNGGGCYNHILYCEIIKPGNRKDISPALSNAITRDFGTIDNMIAQINDVALKRFGSGWAWLVVEGNGKLRVGSTSNQDNPLMDVSDFKGIPLIGIDIWEHAYYLKYQNKRGEYVKSFWSLINWEVVSALYDEAIRKQ
ncbi:MAG TPA: superoxide dismutase [Bacteroidales bacterium]|nr:superoxide dismutase [Bacteroidales bacterium]